MSNECENLIEVIGKKEVISKMFELVKSDDKDWGWERRGLAFDFNKVIPYPEEFAKMDARKENSGYQAGGGDWCIQNWGTKWKATFTSAYFVESNKVTEVEGFKLSDYDNPACGRIDYVTAWSPTFPVTKVLSEQFPDLSFKHSYKEEGLAGNGYQVWKAGNLLAEDDGTSAEVVIDNPVLLKILQKYKDMGAFDPDFSDFSIGNYENFDHDLISLHEDVSNKPALAVGRKKDGYYWLYIPFSLSEVVNCIVESLEDSDSISTEELFERLKEELNEKSDEIMAAYGRVIWKYGGEGFKFEHGEESYTMQNDGEVEEDEDYDGEDNDDQSYEEDDYEDLESPIKDGSDDAEDVELKEDFVGEEFSIDYDNSKWIIEQKSTGKYEIKKYLGNETSPVFPKGISSIGYGAFEECNSIVSVSIPQSVDRIWACAFRGCINLVSLVIPHSDIFMDYEAFKECINLSSIEFPKRMMQISENTFEGCESLSSVIIPNTMWPLGEGAFKDCLNLQSVILLGTETIPANCFEGCEQLMALDIPNGTETIDNEAFSGCASLTTVRIPKSVDYISSHAFIDCPNLVIYTPKASYASNYAKQYGIPLVEE